MTTFDLFLPARTFSVWRPRRQRPFAANWTLITSWIERVRQRHALAALDERDLRDIGISRVDATREAQKPFWR
jgi:uncharacterized protein YjiS (DUF1127 family)